MTRTGPRTEAWKGDHGLFQMYGLDVDELGEGKAILSGTCHERFGNAKGLTLHGGSYGGYGACAAEVAAATVLPPDKAASFIEYRVQIFRPLAVGNTVRCVARVMHRGSRYLGLMAEVQNAADGRTCALFTGTFAVVPALATPQIAPVDPTPPREVAEPRFNYEMSVSWTTWGVRTESTGERFARVHSAFDPRFIDHSGALHPAFVAAVADSVTVPTCATVVDPDESYTTLEYKVNFLRPITGGDIWAEGRIVDKDHRAFVVDVSVIDSADAVCARMLTSLAVLSGSPSTFLRARV